MCKCDSRRAQRQTATRSRNMEDDRITERVMDDRPRLVATKEKVDSLSYYRRRSIVYSPVPFFILSYRNIFSSTILRPILRNVFFSTVLRPILRNIFFSTILRPILRNVFFSTIFRPILRNIFSSTILRPILRNVFLSTIFRPILRNVFFSTILHPILRNIFSSAIFFQSKGLYPYLLWTHLTISHNPRSQFFFFSTPALNRLVLRILWTF
jgi:hypothetical protein